MGDAKVVGANPTTRLSPLDFTFELKKLLSCLVETFRIPFKLFFNLFFFSHFFITPVIPFLEWLFNSLETR